MMIHLGLAGFAGGASASIISVGGDMTTLSPAPTDAQRNQLQSDTQLFAFEEQQNLKLGVDIEIDTVQDDGVVVPGVISAGTVINIHLIHADPETARGDVSGTIAFDGKILGFFFRTSSLRGTDQLLGLAGTTYESSLNTRGAGGYPGVKPEGSRDTVTFIGPNSASISFHTLSSSMDEIRIITAAVLEANIDIKPGSDPNYFNINGHGVIPVAVLGSDTFDVTLIDPSSLRFGGLDVRVRGNKGEVCGLEDTSGDGLLDLVCQFEDDSGNWEPGDGEATLTGELFDGTVFEGSDSICVTQDIP